MKTRESAGYFYTENLMCALDRVNLGGQSSEGAKLKVVNQLPELDRRALETNVVAHASR
jgi:hypothetical protein